MLSADEIVLDFAASALAQDQGCWLCTVAHTFGASPRPLGALLAMRADGQLSGSLSGGCIEDDLLEKLHSGALGGGPSPQLIEYGVSAEENERFGLPCGGRMKVLVEPLAPGHLTALRAVLHALGERRAIRREVELASGGWRLGEGRGGAPLSLSPTLLTQDFGPRFQLVLIGANELARCIAEIARAMDYRVLVNDPRPERLAQWQAPGVELLGGMPDDVVRNCARDEHSIVITLTHDPRIDDMALMEALTQPLFYVGALGSKRTSEKRRDRLRALELTTAQLDKLHAPVGLDIGSRSAMEIAVSVMAELTALRAGRCL